MSHAGESYELSDKNSLEDVFLSITGRGITEEVRS